MGTRTVRRDATENRAALLGAARAILPQNPQAGLETIAQAAGLSRRAVYGHFPSRDDLVREVVTTGAERVLAAMPRPTDLAPLAPEARLASIAAALWAEVSHVRSMAQLAVRGPFVQRVAEVFAPLRASVREACAAGITAGTFRDDVDAATLARLVEGACFTLLDEATRSHTDEADGHRMVVLSALGAAGLDWRAALAAVPPLPTTTTPTPTPTPTEQRP